MTNKISLYCHAHQPRRIRRYRVFDIGSGGNWFDDELNARILKRVAEKCYLPTNKLLLELIKNGDADFCIAFSLSGVFLDQVRRSAPEVLESFQALAETGKVEFVSETYYHSLASLIHLDEFREQVALHRKLLKELFGHTPSVFRNTELVYFDELAPLMQGLGFKGGLVEGADFILEWRSPNYVYEAAGAPGFKLLARNYRLSDDIGFRFSNRGWNEWPLTSEKYARWVRESPGDCVHVFIDFETFGEHQWPETGIFDFLRALPKAVAREGISFVPLNQRLAQPACAPLSFPRPTSWADTERDVSAWLGNKMQFSAHERLFRLRDKVLKHPELLETWRTLSTSDHFYYMCVKWFSDGDVHKYFNPYDTPYDAFIAYLNVLEDFQQVVEKAQSTKPKRTRKKTSGNAAAMG